MSSADVTEVLSKVMGSYVTGTAHQAGQPSGAGYFPGWTALGHEHLNQIRHGRGGPPNRNELPPHKYLVIPGGKLNVSQIQYLQRSYWINDLQRPSAVGFGIGSLAPSSADAWRRGRKIDALVEQVAHGNTSIEIYYLGGKPVI
jgi:hypothetical protein